MELGPRFILFLNQMQNWFLSVTWNPYVKGERKLAGEESKNISGHSYMGTFGYRLTEPAAA